MSQAHWAPGRLRRPLGTWAGPRWGFRAPGAYGAIGPIGQGPWAPGAIWGYSAAIPNGMLFCDKLWRKDGQSSARMGGRYEWGPPVWQLGRWPVRMGGAPVPATWESIGDRFGSHGKLQCVLPKSSWTLPGPSGLFKVTFSRV